MCVNVFSQVQMTNRVVSEDEVVAMFDTFDEAMNVETSTQIVAGTSPMNFDAAREYCQSLDMELLSVHSEETRDEARSMCSVMNHAGSSGCWVGLHQPAGAAWEWTDGSPMDYGFTDNDGNRPTVGSGPWYAGEPNNWGGAEDCTHIFVSQAYNWNDMPCSNTNIPLCAAVQAAPDCQQGVNYALQGVPCSISGDPHYVCLQSVDSDLYFVPCTHVRTDTQTIFNGARHDFQGLSNGQFYYITYVLKYASQQTMFN